MDTNWSVITGAPSSGKTTLINALAKRGYRIAEEVARAYISELLEQHHNLSEIRARGLDLQRKILAMKEQREQRLPAQECIFFDRGIPDSIAYYRFHHFNPQEVVEASQHFRYRHIFFMEGLPVQKDEVRNEDQEMARQLGDYIYSAYRSLGYEITRVPAFSVQERLELVLQTLNPSTPVRS